MDDMQVLYGERFVQRHLKGVSVSVTPLLSLRFADSGT